MACGGMWTLAVRCLRRTRISQKKQEVAGVTNLSFSYRSGSAVSVPPQTVTDLDLAIHGIDEKGAPEGLPLPYRVTWEWHSRGGGEGLSGSGNRATTTLPTRKRRFIHYGMVPGLGSWRMGFCIFKGNPGCDADGGYPVAD